MQQGLVVVDPTRCPVHDERLTIPEAADGNRTCPRGEVWYILGMLWQRRSNGVVVVEEDE